MHLHKQKLTKYFRGHYIIMVGVTNFKELGVTFSCSVFAAFFWELPKNFPHVWTYLPSYEYGFGQQVWVWAFLKTENDEKHT